MKQRRPYRSEVPESVRSFVQDELERAKQPLLHNILDQMVAAALKADLGNGAKVSVYTDSDPTLAQEGRYDLMALSAEQMTHALRAFATTLLISTNLKFNATHELECQTNNILAIAEKWDKCVNEEE